MGITGLLILSAIVISSRSATAAVGINKMINFQGKVTNPNGTNVANGSYTFVFSMYTVASGGSAAWTDTETLTVTDGIFQYNLGSDTVNAPLPGSVDFNSDNIFLGITFNNDSAGEMTPRIRLTSAPYAFNADKLDGLDSSAFVQLSPSGQQTGNINVSGSGTFGGGLAVTGNSTIAGTLGSLTGITSSGTITFSGLNSVGVVQTNGSGVLSTSNLNLQTGPVTGVLQIGNGGTGANTAQGALNAISQLTTNGDIIYHNGTNSTRLARGSDGSCLVSNATTIAWTSCTGLSIGSFSTSGNVNGLSITGSNLFLHAATGTQPGAVSTGAQDFAGAKTFLSAITAPTSSNTINGLVVNTGALSSVTGYTQSSGTMSVTSAATSGNVLSVTDTAFNTNGANLANLAFTNANSSATSTAVTGLNILPTGSTNANANANTLNAINLPNVTTVANNAFYALNVGTGYNDIIRYNGTQIISGTGIVQSAAVSGSYTGITGVGTITTGTWNGTDIAVADGGTGSSTAQGAINNLAGLTTNGDLLYHNGTNAVRLARGSNTQCLLSNATTILWGTCTGDGGVTTVGAFSGSAQTNGATISGTTITFGPADASTPGMVSTGSQTWAGTKTFNSAIVAPTSSNTINGLVINSGALSSVTGYNQSSGTMSVTSAATSGNVLALSDTALNANNANLASFTFTNANSSATATTISGLSITPTGSTNANANANTLNAINLPNVTTVTNNAFYAMNVGTGYNDILRYNGTQLISGTGILQSVALSGSYTGITGVGTITTGTWNGTDIAIADGGTGSSTAQGAINNISGLTTNGDLLYHNGTNVTRLARGSNTQCLTANATTILWGTCEQSSVTTVGTFSGTSIANGASISGNTITFGPADATNPGMVSTSTQTFAGAKTFVDSIVIQGGTATLGTTTQAGTLTVSDGSSNTISLTATGVGTNYTLTLPNAVGATGTCMRAQNGTGTLEFSSCTAGRTVRMTLVPEYTGATMTADGSNNNGTMTSDFCSGTSRKSINTAICAATDEHNYYSWTSDTSGTSDYDIYVPWQAPSDFSALSGSTPVFMYGWRTDATTNTVELSLFDDDGDQCGATTNVATGTATWTETAIGSISGDTDCSGIVANDVVIFRIKVTATGADFARAGRIRIDYTTN